MNEFLVYGTHWCPACRNALSRLKEHRASVKFVDVDQPGGPEAMSAQLAQAGQPDAETIPQIFVKTPDTYRWQYIGGGDHLASWLAGDSHSQRVPARRGHEKTTKTQFILYGDPDCPYTQRANADLLNAGFTYEEIRFVDVAHDDAVWAVVCDRVEACGGGRPRTVPQVFFVDGRDDAAAMYIGGSQDLKAFLRAGSGSAKGGNVTGWKKAR